MGPVIVGFWSPVRTQTSRSRLPLHPGWFVLGERTCGDDLHPLRAVVGRLGSSGTGVDRVHVY